MAESYIQLPTDGSGKKAHTFQRTIGANTIEDEVVILGEQYLATSVATASSVSIATLSDHVMQVMAGSSLNVRVRAIYIDQVALATTAGLVRLQLLRLTTAGTGGTAVTVRAYDTSDSPGATSMTLPTVKGTEGSALMNWGRSFAQAHPFVTPTIIWEENENHKPIIIPAGTANGLAIKVISNQAAATVSVNIEFDESSF